MYCSKCGTQISDDMRFCPKCGNSIIYTTNTVLKERHGFTSFWLITGAIFCFIGGFSYMFSPNTWILIYYNLGIRLSRSISFIYGLCMVIAAIGYILLLSWKKVGFWLMTIDWIIQAFLCVTIGMNLFLMLIFSAMGILILWGVLHIRKNGYSAWDHMSMNYNLDQKHHINVLRRCGNCRKEYDGSYTSCPHCGSSLFSEINNPDGKTTGSKDDGHIEKKKCQKCGTLIRADIFTCPRCGGTKFD